MTAFATWEEADAYARAEANRSGMAMGVEAQDVQGYCREWVARRLPRPENRYGWECTIQAVEPDSPRSVCVRLPPPRRIGRVKVALDYPGETGTTTVEYLDAEAP